VPLREGAALDILAGEPDLGATLLDVGSADVVAALTDELSASTSSPVSVSTSREVAESDAEESLSAFLSLRPSTSSSMRSSPAATCSALARIVAIVAGHAAIA